MFRSSSIAALAASAVALLAVPALAQVKDGYADRTYDPMYYEDDVVVIAPGVRRERTGERSNVGAPIEELTAQRIVYTGDLNLRYDADVEELQRRIRATAIQACEEIDRASRGVMLDTDRECIRDAERSAMVEAQAMIYAARG